MADKLHISRLGNYSFSTMLDTPGYIPLLKLLANGNANGPFVIRMGARCCSCLRMQQHCNQSCLRMQQLCYRSLPCSTV